MILILDNVDFSIYATVYYAFWNRNLRKPIKAVLKTEYHFQNFIDIRFGKGKARLYVAHFRILEKVVGIKFNKCHLEVSKSNLGK